MFLLWPFLVVGGALGVIIGGVVKSSQRETLERKRDERTRLIFSEELKKRDDERAKARAAKAKADPPPAKPKADPPPAKSKADPPADAGDQGKEKGKAA